jgi:hypothetical protein
LGQSIWNLIVSSTLAPLNDLDLHEELRKLNEGRLQPTYDRIQWRDTLAKESERRVLEDEFLETAREEIAERAATAPGDHNAFLSWFLELRAIGPGQHDPLFDWLESQATLAQFRWFLSQEVAGEAGFDDLVALAQLKMPTQCKLELARNYWDEMGRGMETAMHGPMLGRLASIFELDREGPPVWEALALGNLLAGLAFNRRYAYHALGALGAVELTAPDRSRLVNLGLKRLRVPANDRQYYALHATVDIKHSAAWNAEIIVPLVREDPSCATAIAEGALMRLKAGERCFARYKRELGLAA